MHKHWLMLGALVLVALPGVSWGASSAADGAKLRNLNGDLIEGVNRPDTTARALTTDENGNLYVVGAFPDRDHWVLQNSGVLVTDIGARVLYKTVVPQTLEDYSELGLMVSWASSDTDTVALDIYCVGKTSANPADGLDFEWDSDDTNAQWDGFFVCNAAGKAAYGAASSSRIQMVGKTVNFPTAGMSAGNWPGVTTTSKFFPITDIHGNYPHFPILAIWVGNHKASQMDDVTVDIWAKVK